MRNSIGIISIFALVGILGATETRVWTLAQGNVDFLYDDEVIINLYPSQMFNFSNHYTLENALVPGARLAGAYRYVSIKYLLGNLGAGAYLGRAYGLNFIYDDGNPDDVDLVMVITPLDFLFGYNFGAGAFGMNLTFGTSSTLDTALTGGGDDIRRSVSMFRILPSLTLDMGRNTGLDLGMNFTLMSGKHKVGNNVIEKVGRLLIGIRGRFYHPMFIVPINLVIDNYRNEMDNDNYKKESSIFLRTGLANHLNLGDGFAYGGVLLSFASTTTTVAIGRTEAEASASEFNIGLIFGGEFRIWRELYTRASLSYNLLSFTGGNPKTSALGLPGGFTLGVGYDFGLFRTDFAVSTDLIQNGPYFLTGNPSAFVTMFSLIGRF